MPRESGFSFTKDQNLMYIGNKVKSKSRKVKFVEYINAMEATVKFDNSAFGTIVSKFDLEAIPKWKEAIDAMEKMPQRQDSLNDQLRDLVHVANKLGFYDAADHLKRTVQ